jgi:hypothetical protein
VRNIRTSTYLGLVLILALTCSGFTAMSCSKEEKKQTAAIVVDLLGGVPALIRGWKGIDPARTSGAERTFNGITTLVSGYLSDPTNDNFLKGLNAFDAALNANLFNIGNPAKTAQLVAIATLGRKIYSRFGPATLAEMDETSEDGKAIRRELERDIKELKRLVQLD